MTETASMRDERPFLVHVRDTIEWYLRNTWLGKRRRRLIFIKTKFGLEPIRNYWFDRRYGGWLGGAFPTSYGRLGMYGTSSADYSMLPKLFNERNGTAIKPDDVLVDIGCGRGRVLNWWLSLGYGNKIVGIELEEQWVAEVRARLARFPNVTIVQGDALDSIPADGTVFYLFNSFGPKVMEQFKERLLESLPKGASFTLVYHFAMHMHVFEGDSRFTVEPVRTKTFHPSVVIRPANHNEVIDD
jgi:SAM-dependent methyltransferase